MTPTPHRLRRHGLGAFCVVAGLVFAGAATASATTVPDSSVPEGTAAEGAAEPVDLDALIAAANEEGQVNLIALPPTWANYEGILASFNEK